jgi:membrane protease YdiL (CAAX protease family)
MLGNFERFRTRYILLDAVIIFFCVSIIVGIIPKITGIPIKYLTKGPIANQTLGILFVIPLLFTIFLRLKKNKIQIKYIIGDTSIRTFPWIMLLIIFYGIWSLMNGIAKLTVYFTNLVSPDLARSAVVSANRPYTYESDSLLIKVLVFIGLFIAVVVIAPLVEEFQKC